MHCTFGSLPDATLEHYEHYWEMLTEAFSKMSESQHERVIARLQDRPHGLVDLFDVVEPWHPDRGWLEEAASGLEYLRNGGADIAIGHCEFEPGPTGFLAIDVRCLASTFEMQEGDVLVGGATLLRDGEAEPVALPRLYRLICTNGLVRPGRNGAATELREGEVAQTIARALSQENTATVAQLRSALQLRVADPAAMLERFGLTRWGDVLAAREEDDDSLYGLINTVTAHARRFTSFPARLLVEADAGRLLEAMLRPDRSPRRRPRGRPLRPRRPAGAAAPHSGHVTAPN